MSPTRPIFDSLQPSTIPNRFMIPVPWERAESLRRQLEGRGIACTACLDPANRAAALEFSPDADFQTVQGILCESKA